MVMAGLWEEPSLPLNWAQGVALSQRPSRVAAVWGRCGFWPDHLAISLGNWVRLVASTHWVVLVFVVWAVPQWDAELLAPFSWSFGSSPLQ